MDSQERHEIKQNDLEYFITHFGEYWQKYGMTTMIVILAFLVGVLGMRWWNSHAITAKEAAYAELAETDSPQIIQDVAARHDGVDHFSGYALLKAADNSYRSALGLMPNQSPAGAAAPAANDEERDRKLKDAATLYERVINLDQSKLQVLNARFGLAATYESLREFGKAAEQYGKIQADAGDSWPSLAEKAGKLAANLDTVAEPVTFPAPAPPKLGGDLPAGHPPLGPLGPLAPQGPPTPTRPTPLLPQLDPANLPNTGASKPLLPDTDKPADDAPKSDGK
ncbi:MAG: hypothetical protein GC159_08570 [Phycisphaera sp.]|nr:hypothetical protein [Phycisphaera sp.]